MTGHRGYLGLDDHRQVTARHAAYPTAALLWRFGGDIASNTMAAGVVLITQAVQPAINVPRDHLLNSDLVYGDETTVQVLKEPRRNAQIGCAPGRGAVYATKLYAGIRPGAMLITDGYEVYKSIARVSTLTYVGCWVHARRPFIRAEEALLKTARSPEQITSRFVRLIGKLYRVGPWQGTQGAHAA